jgi:hypothetical protein
VPPAIKVPEISLLSLTAISPDLLPAENILQTAQPVVLDQPPIYGQIVLMPNIWDGNTHLFLEANERTISGVQPSRKPIGESVRVADDMIYRY